MKAAVLKAPSDLRVEDIPEPSPGPEEIKIKIAYCGLCGTDPESVAGHFPPFVKPYVLGHESAGTIVELGNRVTGFKVAQNVTCNFRSYCGHCYYCRSKMEQYCENAVRSSGGMAQYGVFHQDMVHALPDNISLDIGALAEPVSIALHGIDRANVYPGCSVMVSGAGPIGLLLLQMAVHSGAARVLVSEPIASKRKLAEEMGADITVNPLKDDIQAAANKLTEGRGFDTVIDASGRPDVAKLSLSLAARCGTVLWSAVYPGGAEIGVSPLDIMRNEISIHANFLSPYAFPRSIAMMPRLQLEPLITDIIPLADIHKAFEIHKKGQAIKILIKP
jgi:2-desacetyl-2-hydroxyethyl bacteriochlorophyllide A dehydrogenase